MPDAPWPTDLRGARVLVVEDDYYLASDLQDLLVECGAAVLGPFADAAQAVQEIDRSRPDLALVDINLGQGPTFAVPTLLLERAIPFAFVTGYDQGVLPTAFQHVPRMEKPITTTLVRATADALLAQARQPR